MYTYGQTVDDELTNQSARFALVTLWIDFIWVVIFQVKTAASSSLSSSFYLGMQVSKLAANEADVDLQLTNKT